MNALIPLKRLDRAKSRLQDVLNPGERFELMRLLLDNTLTGVLRTPRIARVILVSSEPESSTIAAEWGIDHFDDRGLPWNDALAAAMGEAVDSSAVLILSADLPLVTVADISSFVDLAPIPGLAVARAVDGGTNGLVMSPALAMETCFGVKGSAAQHRSVAERAGLASVVADIPGLALDLDSKDDVLKALAGDLPAELRTLLAAVSSH